MTNPPGIEVIDLTRGHTVDDGRTKPLGPFVTGGGHCVYAPYDAAEREVKRRCFASWAERTSPPDGIAFVRTWEGHADPVGAPGTALADILAREQLNADPFGLAREAAASCALDGDTHSVASTFGPAAEMAAAARVAAGGPIDPASYDTQAALAPKARRRGR